jgi:hypothetical protein
MVKLLRHDHVTVVFTMSNKRASHQHMKEKAVKQLAEFMKLEHTNRTQEASEPQGIKVLLGSGLKSRSTITE